MDSRHSPGSPCTVRPGLLELEGMRKPCELHLDLPKCLGLNMVQISSHLQTNQVWWGNRRLNENDDRSVCPTKCSGRRKRKDMIFFALGLVCLCCRFQQSSLVAPIIPVPHSNLNPALRGREVAGHFMGTHDMEKTIFNCAFPRRPPEGCHQLLEA